MGVDSQVKLTLDSKVVSSEFFHKIILNGFDNDETSYPDPFLYKDEENPTFHVNLSDYSISGDVRGDIRETYFGPYLEPLVKFIQANDEEAVLTVRQSDEAGWYHEVMVIYKQHWLCYPFCPKKLGDMFPKALDECEQNATKWIRYLSDDY